MSNLTLETTKIYDATVSTVLTYEVSKKTLRQLNREASKYQINRTKQFIETGSMETETPDQLRANNFLEILRGTIKLDLDKSKLFKEKCNTLMVDAVEYAKQSLIVQEAYKNKTKLSEESNAYFSRQLCEPLTK